MIRLVEALNFRCLCYTRQALNKFQVLIGPNASGKSTFLDVVVFLRDLLSKGLDEAIRERTSNIQDLFFFHEGHRFELAVELSIPNDRMKMWGRDQRYRYIRYEVCIGRETGSHDIHIFDEQVVLLSQISGSDPKIQRALFPPSIDPPSSIMHGRQVGSDKRRVVRKVYDGNDNYYSEVQPKKEKGGWAPSIRLGPKKSALANLPEDEINFPVSTWLRETLENGIQHLLPNNSVLRQTSRPGQGSAFKPDGSNLPWVIQELIESGGDRYARWIDQLQRVIPDLVGVAPAELPDTRHRYLQLVYRNDLKVPAWMDSDGTLRMLALTLPAFLPHFEGVYLIEEPDNGIHPLAMKSVYQTLRRLHGAQMFLSTHSPVMLALAQAAEMLCFKRTRRGATEIVAGSDHPALDQGQDALKRNDWCALEVLR